VELNGLDGLVERTGLSRNRVVAALTALDDGEPGEAAEDAAARAGEEREARARVQQSRVEMMRAYAEARACRRKVLLGYFGEPLDQPCGNCDRCAAGGEEAATAETGGEGRFPVDARVTHPAWGSGRVMGSDGGILTVYFDSVGYKTLALELVEAGDLLIPEA